MTALVACGEPTDLPGGSKRPPNVIYILADDLGYGDLGAYNSESRITTPHLDRLASEGMRFVDAHSPSAVCTPTRYALLTGRYSWRSPLKRSVLWSYGETLIEPGRLTLGSLLRAQGYATAVVGKWHLGLDWTLKQPLDELRGTDRVRINEEGLLMDIDDELVDFEGPVGGGPASAGFEESFILPSSLDIPPYVYLENNRLVAPVNDVTEGNDLDTGAKGAFWRPGPMMEGFDFYDVLPRFTRRAISYLERQATTPDPFFLYLPLPAPHTPWVPTPEHTGRSDAGQYGDFVTMVDAEVGKLLEAVERLELTSSTIIVFTSDNGPYWRPEDVEEFDHRAAGPLRGMKADVWEGGHRVPFLVRWPGEVEPGSVCPRATSLTNWVATMADVLTIDLAAGEAEDSRSILSALRSCTESAPSGEEPIVHHSASGVFAIRQGDWKLIEGLGSGGFSEPRSVEPGEGDAPGQLYRLDRDLGETTNLYLEEPEVAESLTELLTDVRAGRTGF